MLMRAATVVHLCASLAGLVLSFIACFILLVIAPLAVLFGLLLRSGYHIFRSGRNGFPSVTNVVLLVVLVVISTKAFPNFQFMTDRRQTIQISIHLVVESTLSTIAPCRIFKLITNYLIIINF